MSESTDAADQTDQTDQTDPGSAPPRSRQTVALWVAGGLAVLAVVGVLALTLFAGGSASEKERASLPEVTAAPTTTFPKILDGVDLNPTVPDGDYGSLCSEIKRQLVGLEGGGVEAQLKALTTLDFDRLIAAAPEGFKPTLTTLRDSREEVAAALEQVKSIDELEAADLPEGFLPALILSGRATEQKC